MPAPARRPARRRHAARLGVFGGTFDPPHLGHLAIAEWARDRLRLDRVIFIPAGQPPHKRIRGRSSAAARLDMARKATRGHAAFAVSTIEMRRDGPSFTVDTLRLLRQRHPGARLFLILGTDSLEDFTGWRDPDGIARQATLVVASRSAGTARSRRRPIAPGARAIGRGVIRLDNPENAISSSLIRSRVRSGRSIRGLVPDAVARYIARHGLYRRPRVRRSAGTRR